MSAPKLFISYSWSDAEHEEWVVNLAKELCEAGINVILDKWELKEGHDAVVFMEKMVTDPEIKKVAIISNENYAAKADGRDGGVGTETQIISKEVYERQDQNKFVAIVTEKDANGKAFLPTYYKSRIYIDLSEDNQYAENYEKLLRWVFDKPLYKKPELGSMPTFLSEEVQVTLGTAAISKRCIDAIKNDKSYATGAFDEYCNSFATNLERFRLTNTDGEFDDLVVKSIEQFLPFRNEFIQLITVVAQYSPTEEHIEIIHKLFENLMPYMCRPTHITEFHDYSFDNYKFIIHELFLYTLAIFLNKHLFPHVNLLLQRSYYFPGEHNNGNAMVSFIEFRKPVRAFNHRKQRLKSNSYSIRADLLEERCKGIKIDFQSLMQADFVIYMRAEIEAKDEYRRWWPETLLYLGHFRGPFEIFGRAVSKEYFNKVKIVLGINNPRDMERVLNSYRDGTRQLPHWDHNGFSPRDLLGYELLATQK